MISANIDPRVKQILLITVLVLSTHIIAAGPVMADDEPEIRFCDDATDTASTIETVFVIFSVLGPVFGTLFFIGMTVADSAKMKGEYQQERKRVLLYGFSVPISIAFLEVVGSQLIDQRIDCFFP